MEKRWGLRDHGTHELGDPWIRDHELGVSQKWFGVLSRLIEWYLYTETDGWIYWEWVMDIHWNYQNLLAFWTGIFWYRLTANQIVRCFELKKLKNYMRYQVDFFLPLKLEKIYYFGFCQKILFCRIFYFWLVWLVNLNTGGPLLHCTCFDPE